MRDETIASRVIELERKVFGMKKAQFSGAGNTQSYIAESSDAWDINETASTTGVSWWGRYGFVRCTFTANDKMAALTTFEITGLIDGVPFYAYTGIGGTVYTVGLVSGQSSGDINVAKYQTQISFGWGCNTGTNVKLKVRAVSLAKGTLNLDKEFNGS